MEQPILDGQASMEMQPIDPLARFAAGRKAKKEAADGHTHDGWTVVGKRAPDGGTTQRASEEAATARHVHTTHGTLTHPPNRILPIFIF